MLFGDIGRFQEKAERLIRFLPYFEDPQREWIGEVGGSQLFPVISYTAELEQFMEVIYQDGWLDPTYLNAGCGRFESEPSLFQQAGLFMMRKLLTFFARGERFCDGFWASAIARGYPAAALMRLRDLAHDIERLSTVPFARSYWLVPGSILAGIYPGAPDPPQAEAKLGALLDCGIRVIFNLMSEDETVYNGHPFQPYETTFQRLAQERKVKVECLRFPIPDLQVPSSQTMRDLVRAFDRFTGEMRPLYIHSRGGVGRIGTVAACLLRRHRLAGETSVFRTLQKLREGGLLPPAGDTESHRKFLSRESPETEGQRRFAMEWKLDEED